MLNTIAVVSYLLGNHFGQSDHLKLSARFLEEKNQSICASKVVSPSLRWRDIPPEAKSIAVVVKDAVPLRKNHYYWVVYNLPVESTALPFAASDYMLANHQGLNSWGERKYHSPCWGGKMHAVKVELFALEHHIPEGALITGNALEKKIHASSVLAQVSTRVVV